MVNNQYISVNKCNSWQKNKYGKKYICLFIAFFFIINPYFSKTYSQTNEFELIGIVQTVEGKPLSDVHIVFIKEGRGAVSSDRGTFSILLPTKFPIELKISAIGWKQSSFIIKEIPKGQITIELIPEETALGSIEITGARSSTMHVHLIDPDFLRQLPSAAGHNIEGLVRSQIGVSGNSELSSQYRVRGGNFDENLIYVNGQEIYRPFLIHSGQQEGLSFVNPDLVEYVEFSAGAFDASYGDKMSSVLDIHYKKPKNNEGSASVGMLGANAHYEGTAIKNKFTWIAGTRYKTNKYLLGTLDEKGEYQPVFFDIQTYFTYKVAPRLTFDLLAYYSDNKYNFIPHTRVTSFGTATEVKLLEIYFDGQEKDNFQTGYGAFSANFKQSNNSDYKLTVTAFRNYEEESYDILSQYWLKGIIDPRKDIKEDNYSEEGIGTGLKHARNSLFGTVASANFRASHKTGIGNIEWGAIYQYESFKDKIHEWEMIDSAFYSIPRNFDKVELSYFKYGKNIIENHRTSAFLKNRLSWKLNEGSLIIDAGIRGSYASFNDEFIVSPRILMTYLPHQSKNYRIRFAGGYYFQPPFVKEYRMPNGELNRNLKAQKSLQFVAGIDYYFFWDERPFKFTTETYYKKLDNLISYWVDNVRIIYSGENDAHGYATGIDFKLNGELVPGEESWVTISFMKTAEDLWNDVFINPETEGTPGYIPRPSDQRFNFSMFIQDKLPSLPEFKAHLSLFLGTGLPYGPPNAPKYFATFRSKAYRRADFGMSYDLLTIAPIATGFGQYLKNLWIGVEIFNLFDINNTISYTWVNDIQGGQYAVPNYLTSRRLNFKISVRF